MRKKKEKEEGAPAWMLTYGDLVTQVLCFFVLLFSMSSIDVGKFKRIFFPEIESPVPLGPTPAEEAMKRKPGDKRIDIVSGVEIPVYRIPEGLKITLEGDTFFEEGSYTLEEDKIIEKMEGKFLAKPITVREYFDAIAKYIHQSYYKLEVRGHTDVKKEDSIYIKRDSGKIQYDWFLLSFYRSQSTINLLRKRSEELFKEQSLTPEKRFEIVAYGRTKPIFPDSIEKPEQSKYNRRVEIIIKFESFLK